MTRAFVLAVLLLVVVGAAATWLLWARPELPTHQPEVPAPPSPRFAEVALRSGVDFIHFDPATPVRHIHETMGGGLAWIDFDNDGWPDLFCVQNGPLFPGKHAGPQPLCRLYRNNRDGTFTDVTEAAGLGKQPVGYGMGCAVGDFDNDGHDDLVVTYLGKVVLYHNQPGGPLGRRFVDVTEKSGLRDPYWATSCGWGDIDGDGLLDLYVCNYVQADLARYQPCVHEKTGLTILCAPFVFQPAPHHHLFRNNGDGTFTDVTKASGVAAVQQRGPGLGVVLADLDGDGKIDIFAANDMTPAFLFHNQGKGKFVEKAALSGCGFDSGGRYLAGMGVTLGDVNGSGRPSLFVTNFQGVPNVLFTNLGSLWFRDDAYPSGLGHPSINFLGFGTQTFDADLDGALDVIVANGHVNPKSKETFGYPYRQTAQVFTGDGKGWFRDVSSLAGPYFREPHVGRAVAVADYDNDGRPDVALGQIGERVALLRNETSTDNRWVRLELIGDGKRSNRNAVGARVEVEAGGRKQTHWVIGGGSYLSSGDRRLLVGLGAANQADLVRVTWPSGRQQEYRGLAGRRWYRLHEGQAEARGFTPPRKPPGGSQ